MQLHTHARERDVHAATHSRQGEECTCSYTLTPGRGMYMQLHTHARERNVHAATHSRQGEGCTCSYTLTPGRGMYMQLHAHARRVMYMQIHTSGRGMYMQLHTSGRGMYLQLHTHAKDRDVHAATHSRQGDGCTCCYTLAPGRVCAELHAGEGDGCTEMHMPWGGVYRTTHSRQGLGCTELHNPQHEKRHRRAAGTLTSGRGMRRTKLRDTMPWSSARSSCLALTMMKRSVVRTVTSSSRKG